MPGAYIDVRFRLRFDIWFSEISTTERQRRRQHLRFLFWPFQTRCWLDICLFYEFVCYCLRMLYGIWWSVISTLASPLRSHAHLIGLTQSEGIFSNSFGKSRLFNIFSFAYLFWSDDLTGIPNKFFNHFNLDL